MDYPELAARTHRFSSGAPRAVTVSGDGQRVVFLRSGGPEDPRAALWVVDLTPGAVGERLIADPANLRGSTGDPEDAELPAAERALRERLRLSAAGIGSFALDAAGTVAAFAICGQLFLADLVSGTVTAIPTAGPAMDPRPDPAGRRIAYVTGNALHVVDLADIAHPQNLVLAAEDRASWGLAEFIGAEEFHRYRGYWWAPDGRSILAQRVDESRVPRWYLSDPANPHLAPRSVAYPHAGADNAEVTLHLLDLDGGWVDIRWDRETYPYLVAVSWTTSAPLLSVLRRHQQHGLVLTVDPRTGEAQAHAEVSDPRWVEPLPGTPVYLPDSRVLIGGELAHEGYDARCLFADGTLTTPSRLYIRRLVGLVGRDRDAHLIVEASEGEPSEQHVYQVPVCGLSGVAKARRLTADPGWHHASIGGSTMVIGSASLERAGTRWAVHRDGEEIWEIASLAAAPPYAPRPVLQRVTDRRLPTGVLYPRSHVAGRKLPVLVDAYGGPGHQEVVAARARWLGRQWWADQGFAVVTIDNRGTPGVSPSFEKSVFWHLADVVLADQVDALLALTGKHPDLDLDRVAIRGWSFGGWLAALAALRRPDVYRVAVAGAPVTDWALYDTAYTERYLGLPAEVPEVYAHNSLVELASEPPARPADARPILLIHGLLDDNVVAAHTLRLSAAMLATGRPHAVIPLPGATHMAAGGTAERLLRIELDFVRRGLARP
ncbi:MAG: prolyl oligopeptidase family serine peptidase [Dactylosporangium sp.]|nr:prolyl oligopeptidase family serine peptidase [Dactylosporangium sp.]NNJ63822.1 prolyl oligopeptidase family serine peptidase [Dactylosporangium sp.]